MEAFEKWIKNLPYRDRECRSPEFYSGIEDGWKAAFENMQQWIMGRRCTGEEVLEYIIKELQS